MIYKDYYKALGIASTASPSEIKKAFRALVKKYHPDKTKGSKSAEEKFKEVNEANEVLSDPVKRKKYDKVGSDWKQYEQTGAQPGGFDWSKYAGEQNDSSRRGGSQGSSSSFTGEGINDLFEMLFGQQSVQQRGRRGAPAKGEDLETEIALSLEEAYQGSIRVIQVNGQTIKITIKPGVADRQTLRVPEKGGLGSNGGSNGDLYLRIKISPHPLFRQSGIDLYCDLPVDLYTALLGGKTNIRTMKGNVSVNIPMGTPNGKELRLVGLGMPVYGSKHDFGNVMVNVHVVLPELLTEEELDLFKKLSALRK